MPRTIDSPIFEDLQTQKAEEKTGTGGILEGIVDMQPQGKGWSHVPLLYSGGTVTGHTLQIYHGHRPTPSTTCSTS